ncbi:uncharacterized protein HKW66_Vig0247690 [Vigna angularis]|uniref:Uncharacterized protein n=1 Tax=Phaseolus angularis TaxID=3914 RepID=A0A8T0KU32_PHAAN|nr:uncharacterized protein HKW66_Vig0247690 [Vigna angularis]
MRNLLVCVVCVISDDLCQLYQHWLRLVDAYHHIRAASLEISPQFDDGLDKEGGVVRVGLVEVEDKLFVLMGLTQGGREDIKEALERFREAIERKVWDVDEAWVITLTLVVYFTSLDDTMCLAKSILLSRFPLSPLSPPSSPSSLRHEKPPGFNDGLAKEEGVLRVGLVVVRGKIFVVGRVEVVDKEDKEGFTVGGCDTLVIEYVVAKLDYNDATERDRVRGIIGAVGLEG